MGRRLAIELFLIALVGLVLGAIGPFGTFEIPIAPRVAYWLAFVIAGYALFRPLILAGQWLNAATGVPEIVAIGGALLLASAPLTLLVAMMTLRSDPATALAWTGLPQLYLQVWLIGFLINGLFYLLFRQPPAVEAARRPEPAATPGEIPPPPARFEDRLPPGFGPLLALRSEDHYVRAIGSARETLILIRLRDAVAELGDCGIQVHRSWWVARDAIASARREGRAATLVLTNGGEVPVSRDAMPGLRATGWAKEI